MNKIFRGCLFTVLSGALLYICSCTPLSCLDETESYVKASMYVYPRGPKKAPDSLTIYGLNRDTSLIYNKEKNITKARFPLNAQADSSVFIVKINKGTDTIKFYYNTYPHLISKECGYTYYHDLTRDPVFTKHIIDSITVPGSKITNLNEENIRIYY